MVVYVSERVRSVPIPERFNVTAAYPIVPLKESAKTTLARSFISFIQSEPGQEIMRRYGFGPAQPQRASRRTGPAGYPALPAPVG